MKKSKKILNAALGLSVLAVIVVGGTFAYLTDTETTTNVFSVGNVIVDLVEVNKPADDAVFVPNEKVQKNPYITNSGSVDAIVFMEVSVPSVGRDSNVYQIANVDGTAGDSAYGTPLFTALYNGGTVESSFGKLNQDHWILIEESNDVNGYTKYVYGYASILGEKAETSPLFEYVKVANIVRNSFDDNDTKLTFKMPVRAYAIQAGHMFDYAVVLDEKTLTKIFSILTNQETDYIYDKVPDADIHGLLDLNGKGV